MLNPFLNNDILSKEEYRRYAKHLILEEISINGQKRIKKAKILCIGAGGLGCPALLYLAATGINYLGIIDSDKVSKSNLHRQILYNATDINNLKTISAKQAIHNINPSCNVNIYSEILTIENAYERIKKYDIIIDASDNFKTRYIIDLTCYKLHKIHIYGAIEKFEGQITVFNYKNGPKYSDIYPKNLQLDNKKCSNIGVLGMLTGIIGILQATEVIKIITGIGEILSGKILIYNALNMSFKKITIYPVKNNIEFSLNNLIKRTNIISEKELKQKIINNECIEMIDVRQKFEYCEKHIVKSINIPLKEIKYRHNLNYIMRVSESKIIILYCSNNSRSIIASNILNNYSIKHLRLYNGFISW
uniref:Probable molybdopterin-synthase adenylyltransferase n=1 Tax=Leiomenia cribrosa TaxID=217483 RepID=A0A4D6WXL2_9FLOR|nr:Molybdopterin biosynthesis protein [Leiomenia cribrosa]